MSDRGEKHTATVEARIQHIMGMMRDLTFRRGKTPKALAAEWGLAPHTVFEYSSEASRRVREHFESRDDVVVDVGIALQTVIDGAMKDLDEPPLVMAANGEAYPESPNKTRQSIINAADKLAEIMGAKAASRVELSGSVGLEDIEAAKAAAKANEEPSE